MRRHTARRLTPIAFLAALAGCAPTLAPIPDASVVTPPVAWRTHLDARGDVERQWWDAFGDPALSQIVADAQANNPDIAIAAARVREARGQERAARSLLLPTLNATAGISESRSLNAFGSANEGLAAQPLFQAAYEIDLFGLNRAQIDAARANSAATQAAREAATLAVTAATVSGYITLLTLDSRLEILREALAARAEALRIARDRAEAGYTSQLELRQAEAEYRAAQQQIPAIEAAIARQENALSQLVGQTPRAVARGGTFADLQAPAIPAVLPSELTRRRPLATPACARRGRSFFRNCALPPLPVRCFRRTWTIRWGSGRLAVASLHPCSAVAGWKGSSTPRQPSVIRPPSPISARS